MSKPKKITSWSPSRLACYLNCPRQAKYKFVDKLPEESGPAAQRGTDIHATLEQFIMGTVKAVHEAVKPTHKNVKAHLTRLRKNFKAKLVGVELELAFNAGWEPVPYRSDEAWARFKLDILERVGLDTAHVIDWKSGKVREGGAYDDQLNAYAVAALSHHLELREVKASLVFVDHDLTLERPSGKLHRKDLQLHQKKWAQAVKPMMTDTTFRPAPSTLCRWCAFSKAKGGPCDF